MGFPSDQLKKMRYHAQLMTLIEVFFWVNQKNIAMLSYNDEQGFPLVRRKQSCHVKLVTMMEGPFLVNNKIVIIFP